MRTTITLPICILSFLWMTPVHAQWLYQVVDKETNEIQNFNKWPQNLGPNKHLIAIPDRNYYGPTGATTSLVIKNKQWLTSNRRGLAELAQAMRSKNIDYLLSENP